MSAASLTTVSDRSAESPDQPLWLSLGASLLAHAVALMIFAGLLLPFPASLSMKAGEPAVMNVRLSPTAAQEAAIEPSAPVEVAPTAAIEPVIAPVSRSAAEPAMTPVAVPKPVEVPPEPVVPTRHIDLREPASRPAGATTSAEASTEGATSDEPLPQVDITVRTIEDPEFLGRGQALRLAQRFPQAVARHARLQSPLVVFYPAAAARAHREARVSALLIIDAEGNALEATLLPDDPLFARSIEDALRNARYKPAEDTSRPMTHWLILDFVFSMRSSQSAATAVPR